MINENCPSCSSNKVSILYDLSTFIAKVAINLIETVGSFIGFKGFRVVIYAKP